MALSRWSLKSESGKVKVKDEKAKVKKEEEEELPS